MSTYELEETPPIARRTSTDMAHRPQLPERPQRVTPTDIKVRMVSLDDIITKRIARPEPVCVTTPSDVVFSWDAIPAHPVPYTVFLVTLQPNVVATAERVQAYEDTGIARKNVVIVGDYRDLSHQDYVQLKRTGAVLKRIHEDLTPAVRARVEQELAPVFRSIFGLQPRQQWEERPYTYQVNTPPLPQTVLDAYFQRVTDPAYDVTDE